MKKQSGIMFLFIVVLSGCNLLFDNPSPIEIFQKRTGLVISDSVKIIQYKNTYGLNEGEYSIVFSTTATQINEWLDTVPPWNHTKWNAGIIPDSVFNCNFGYANAYSGDSNLIEMQNNPEKLWVSKAYCCEGMPYHNGKLLIIETKKNKVWYSNWDY